MRWAPYSRCYCSSSLFTYSFLSINRTYWSYFHSIWWKVTVKGVWFMSLSTSILKEKRNKHLQKYFLLKGDVPMGWLDCINIVMYTKCVSYLAKTFKNYRISSQYFQLCISVGGYLSPGNSKHWIIQCNLRELFNGEQTDLFP